MLLYAEPLQKRYEAPTLSCSTFIVLVFVVLLIVLPFIIAYSLGGISCSHSTFHSHVHENVGFWLKENIWIEQPTVKFTKDTIVVLARSGGGSTSISWSNRPEFNKYRLGNLRIPSVKTSEVDYNFDGKIDILEFEIEMPLLEVESIQSVKVAFFLEYQFKSYIKMNMKSLAILDLQTPVASSALTVVGNLRFKQIRPIPAWQDRVLYNVPVVNWTLAEKDSDATSWENIVDSYVHRNEISILELPYPIWKSGRAASQPFVIKGKINIVQDKYRYLPTAGELFKWAWIQYFSFLILAAAVIVPLLGFLIKSQFIATLQRIDQVPFVNAPSYVNLISKSVGNSSSLNANNSTFKQYGF